MINGIGKIRMKTWFFALLVATGAALVFLAPNASVNVDEQLHYPHAKKVVNWYFTGGKDASCLDTPDTNLKYYGQSVDNFTALVNRVFKIEDEFLFRHYTGAFFFLLILLFAGLLAYELTGKWLASVIAVLAIIFMPQISGHAYGNLKDIPFSAGYVASVFFIIRYIDEMPSPRWSTTLFMSLGIAFTNSVRIGGLILFIYLFLFSALFIVLYKPFLLKHFFTTKSFIARLFGQAATILAIGWFGALLFWPYALQNVLANPLESLNVMENYKISIRQIFDGQYIWSTELPLGYLPKWLLISTPEFIFAGLFIYVIFFVFSFFRGSENWFKAKNEIAEKRTLGGFFEILILFVTIFPLAYVMVIDSNLYSGVRQMMFVLPGFAVLSSVGIIKLLSSQKLKYTGWGVSALFFCLMILPFMHQIRTFPADYVYFNSLFGGNKKAWGNYEYDYYFHALKQPAEELVKMVGDKDSVTIASNCNLSNYFETGKNLKFKYVRYLERSSEDWDYALLGVNYIHPHLLKSGKWKPAETIKTWYHNENPVVILVKRQNKNDYEGIKELEEGNFHLADSLLNNAIQNDPNNVWVLAKRARLNILTNNFKKAQIIIAKGRETYPDYEPFSVLEAEILFKERKFAESKAILQNLLKFNPFYQPGKKWLEKLNSELNIK